MYILNLELLGKEINNLSLKDTTLMKIYKIINKSYGLKDGDIIDIKKYIYVLTKQHRQLKDVESKYYPYFDIVLCLLHIQVMNKIMPENNKDTKEKLEKHLSESFTKILDEKCIAYELLKKS
jgi:hypothetical protein